MTKKEIDIIVNKMKYQKTDVLKKRIANLSYLEDERNKTKSMYFWSDFGNASSRRSFTKRYSENYTIPLTADLSVRYVREVSPSRKYAYASDKLSLSDGNKFTVGDAKKIAARLQMVVDNRR